MPAPAPETAPVSETAPAPDLTLPEIRALLAPVIAENAAFDGFGRAAIEEAACAANLDAELGLLAFPGGALEVIDAWFASIDTAMLARLTPKKLAKMKVRERIIALVEARLTLLAPRRESLRRALAVLAQPQNIPAATRLGWRTADVMWRAAGDSATDFNHYSKRAILGVVYAATLAVFLNDDSENHSDTRAVLARGIESVMQFEKWKKRRAARRSERLSLTRLIGRLRYPVR